jgi:hypothetical protein
LVPIWAIGSPVDSIYESAVLATIFHVVQRNLRLDHQPPPNQADYENHADYDAAVQAQSHPLATQRLTEVADDIDRNAVKYAINPSSETLAEFRELAAEEHKLAELLSAPDIQQLIARRAKMLEPRDLTPRLQNEIIGHPIGSRVGNGPFDGKLAGTVGSLNVEVFLGNQLGRVTGTLGMGAELVRIVGTVEDLPLHGDRPTRVEVACCAGMGTPTKAAPP